MKGIFNLIFISFFIFSCKKESNELSWGKEFFVNQDWIITSYIRKHNTHNPSAIESDEIIFEDVWINEQVCNKDDIFQFSSNGEVHQYLGLNNCGGPPLDFHITWEITINGNLKVSYYKPNWQFNFSYEYHLYKFSENSFELFLPFVNNDGFKSVYIIRYELN